mgnify:CR=1 FL=1
MSGPHGRGGRRAADSPVHRLPARTKLVALVVFVVAVVAAPPGAWWVYGVAATALALAVILARLDVTTVVRGLAIEIPFVVFALLLPLLLALGFGFGAPFQDEEKDNQLGLAANFGAPFVNQEQDDQRGYGADASTFEVAGKYGAPFVNEDKDNQLGYGFGAPFQDDKKDNQLG